MKDTTNKMYYGNASETRSRSKAKKEEAMKVMDEMVDKEEMAQQPVERSEEQSGVEQPQIEVIKDLDLESFFFTGEIRHTFKFGKFQVEMRLLQGDETTSLHEMLWKLVDKNVSAPEAAMRQMIETVAMSILKYGPNDLSNKSVAEKKEFVGKLPGVITKKLMDCFTQLEYSANKLLEENGSVLKN